MHFCLSYFTLTSRRTKPTLLKFTLFMLLRIISKVYSNQLVKIIGYQMTKKFFTVLRPAALITTQQSEDEEVLSFPHKLALEIIVFFFFNTEMNHLHIRLRNLLRYISEKKSVQLLGMRNTFLQLYNFWSQFP